MNPPRALEALFHTIERNNRNLEREVSSVGGTSDARVAKSQGRLDGNRFNLLFSEAAGIAAKHRSKRDDDDWVFDNFWPNAKEPKHSKLLAYFLDPAASHQCGAYLLSKLLPILQRAAERSEWRNPHLAPHFSPEGCKVEAESGGYIDLRIECPGKFAIIIENKVNGAPDQSYQLKRYVESLVPKFAPSQIYAFYLPLEGDRHANAEDINAITQLGATYVRVTFREHIQEWCETALHSWVLRNDTLREHLAYYLRLLIYLINRNKQNEMDAEILKSITKAEESGPLQWGDVANAATAAESLKRMFLQVLRGRILRQIRQELLRADASAAFYLCIDGIRLQSWNPSSEYAVEFGGESLVAVTASPGAGVGFGWYPDGNPFYYCYLRFTGENSQLDAVVEQMPALLKNAAPNPFSGYWYETVSEEDCAKRGTAERIVAEILRRRDDLRVLLHTASQPA